MPRAKLTKKPKAPSRKKTARKAVAKVLPESQAAPSVAHGYAAYDHQKTLSNKDEKTQRLIIWTGVSVIMTAIVIIWILNLNNMLEANKVLSAQKTTPATDVETLKNDLKSTLEEVQKNFKELEQLKPTATATPAVSPTEALAVTPSATPSVTPSQTPNTLPN